VDIVARSSAASDSASDPTSLPAWQESRSLESNPFWSKGRISICLALSISHSLPLLLYLYLPLPPSLYLKCLQLHVFLFLVESMCHDKGGGKNLARTRADYPFQASQARGEPKQKCFVIHVHCYFAVFLLIETCANVIPSLGSHVLGWGLISSLRWDS
jgi:hypothetical protein